MRQLQGPIGSKLTHRGTVEVQELDDLQQPLRHEHVQVGRECGDECGGKIGEQDFETQEPLH